MMSDDRQQQILSAALRVFTRDGFAKATMNAIVKESGLSKGGVYWHFDSKDAIVIAIFNQFMSGQEALLDTVLAQNIAAPAKLDQLVSLIEADVANFVDDMPATLEFYALATRNPTLKQQLTHFYADYLHKIEALFAQGAAEGVWRPLPTAHTAATFIALFEGVFLLYTLDPHDTPLGQRMKNAINILLTGLNL
ncbi:MAG TPA: TetR/AcrR family transcriptional regulator [Anaerolineae bacterium]|nr:TetR/AcrR family transcriptional regulator [Anaerolineae bacterium]